MTYPYKVLEYALVSINDLLFLEDFVILDMLEDSDTSLLLKRPFLTIVGAPIDVELGELILRFIKEKIIFNVFEAMKHQK